MFLGALVDVGVPEQILREGLTTLGLGDYQLDISREKGGAIIATRVRIRTATEQPPRNWRDIEELLTESPLPDSVKTITLAIFSLLADAEAKVHDCPVEKIHFHEVGAVDSIIDIVGCAICLDYLDCTQLICSPLPMPSGMVSCAHGLLPLPAPAVCEILQDVPVYGVNLRQELVTPTGAALVKGIATDFGPVPAMTINRVGYGCGSHNLEDGRPNMLRVLVGHSRKVSEDQEVEVIECNLDDWSPEGFPLLCERLFALGALDVVLLPVLMKKGRPGFLLQVICGPGLGWEMRRFILSETTAIGLRYRTDQRWTLPRQHGTVNTDLGRVAVKLVETPDGPVLYPEYEDCRRLAVEKSLPLKDIYAAVNRCRTGDFAEGDN